MIYAVSVIKGQESMLGSMQVHWAMAVTMVLYIRPPMARTVVFEDGTSETYEMFAAADWFYFFAIGQHLLTMTF